MADASGNDCVPDHANRCVRGHQMAKIARAALGDDDHGVNGDGCGLIRHQIAQLCCAVAERLQRRQRSHLERGAPQPREQLRAALGGQPGTECGARRRNRDSSGSGPDAEFDRTRTRPRAEAVIDDQDMAFPGDAGVADTNGFGCADGTLDARHRRQDLFATAGDHNFVEAVECGAARAGAKAECQLGRVIESGLVVVDQRSPSTAVRRGRGDRQLSAERFALVEHNDLRLPGERGRALEARGPGSDDRDGSARRAGAASDDER